MGSPIRGGTFAGALLTAAVTLAMALPGSAGAQAFSSPRSLTSTAAGFQEPRVSALGSDVHVAWQDEALGNSDVYYRRGTDGGATFGPARNLSLDGVTPEEEAHSIQVLAHGDNVYLTWVEGGLRFRASENRGATFGPVLELTSYPEGGLRLAASGDDVYMAWYRSLEDEVGAIYFIRSPVEGRVFADVELPNDRRTYGDVELAARGDDVYVVWNDFGSNDGSDIFFRRSTDAGITFEPIQRLITSDGNSREQKLAVQGNAVYVVWEECDYGEGGCEVLLRRSPDAGATFGAVVNVSNTPGDSRDPQLVVRDSRVFVAWHDQAPDSMGPEVFLALSTNGGATFGPAVRVTHTEVQALDVRLVAAGTGVRLVWTEGYHGEREVWTQATLGYGLTLGPAENLSRTPGESGGASIASSQCGARVHVVWLEGSGPTGNAVVYRRGTLPGSPLYCLLLPESR
ncbi:sialidase family protein [Pyxidicoccus xibeiensis]|uniref:sialidase family protein n=1 Tax=Pyxidicoccus xibeiensis TaxID=2906759 RepID=UPI0020A7B8F5|nr:sialidase family protein [Pyxidicoccus xibeiensis]MCP3137320.1 glycoside hydrolase [Pyxidicoccus xibeiensis]